MNKKWIRRLLLGVFYLLILCLFIVVISRLLAYANQGADRGKLLHVALPEYTVMPDIHVKDDGNEGSEITSFIIDQIKTDYVHARDAQSRARTTNNTTYLQDHFTDEVVAKWEEHFVENAKKNIYEQSTSLAHNIDVTFFSLDESVVSFTDQDVIEHHQLYQDEELISSWVDTSDYQVICVLEDSRWRIRQIKKIETQQPKTTLTKQISPTVLGSLVGINYYPAQSPWNLLDTAISDEVYIDDMATLRELGCNSIRIFLQYEDLGKEQVSQAKVRRLLHFLDIAHNADLSVIITLFDFYGDYSGRDWRATSQHLRTLIPAIQSHPALLAYDLKNEPDLDFESRGEAVVADWLSYHIDVIRSIDPNHTITIGWSNPNDATLLVDQVDFVSYHYYHEPSEFSQKHQALSAQTDKPIILTEFGKTSYRGVWNPIQYSQKKQARYYADMLQDLQDLNLSSFSWTLHDFHEVPISVVGRRPWRRAYQRHYGLIDMDGNPKPAFNIISQSSQGSAE